MGHSGEFSEASTSMSKAWLYCYCH